MTESQRAGVLVVSLWLEGSGDTLRARVTETSDINAAGEMTSVVGSLQELLDAVESWAQSFMRPAEVGPDHADSSDSSVPPVSAPAAPAALD